MAQRARALDQTFLFDHLKGGQTGGAGHRILLVRVMSQSGVRGNVQRAPAQHGRQRKNAAAQTFAEHQHVRSHAVVLAGEHASGAAQPHGDFIQNKKRAVLVARGANPFPIIRPGE